MNEPDTRHAAPGECDRPRPDRRQWSAAEPAGDIPEDPRIVEVVQEYLADLEQGRSPNRVEFTSRYPELSQAIEQCLEGLDLVRAETPRSSAGRMRSGGEGGPETSDVPPTALGDFQIVRELARGGMGVVYEAIQLSLGRRVALKVLPFAATFDARQLQRFKNEAQAAALLHHTNIVPVFAVGCERGVNYYAMQLIDGQSLAVLIRQLRRQAGLATPDLHATSSAVHSSFILGGDGQGMLDGDGQGDPGPASPLAKPAGAFPAAETQSRFHANLSTQHAGRSSEFYRTGARLMLQAAQALDHAHEFGIVHRDIKPANLLLDTQGILWVTDFGLAQFHTDAGLTRTGDIPGTIRYMSPEQAAGKRTLLDQRTDIYSLGATFYEFLTLEPIFSGRDLQFLLHQILHNEPRSLRQIDARIPVELETIVLKCVSKNPAERYASAGDLADDLARFLAHEPILARRPTLVDRGRKWSRRHPSAVIAAVLLLATVTAGSVFSNYREQLRANEAEQRFLLARQAVDVLFDVSEDELADNPGMNSTRRRLLGIVLGYYQDLIDQRRGDAAAQGELAAAQERVKTILGQLKLLHRDWELRILDPPPAYDGPLLSEEQREEFERAQKRRRAVQAALSLSDDQQQQIDKLFMDRNRERDALQSLSREARQRRELELAEEHERALDGVLSVQQRTRLKQFGVQAQGLFAFRDPDVVDELKLSREQRKAIRDVEYDLFKQFGRPPGRGRGEPRADSPPMPTRKEVVAKVLAVLSPEQVRKWNALAGPDVEGLDASPLPFPGFRGRHRGPRTPPPDEAREGDRRHPSRGEKPGDAADRPDSAS